jgi:hypothetical protein
MVELQREPENGEGESSRSVGVEEIPVYFETNLTLFYAGVLFALYNGRRWWYQPQSGHVERF